MNIIAIDIGTSRIKIACFDESGNMSHLSGCRLDRAASPVVQDAREWFHVTSLLLREVTAKSSSPPDAVTLTGNMHALLGLDGAGEPVAPAVLWSDNSAEKQAQELNRRYGKALVDLSGNSAIAVFTLPKIMQMQQKYPELYRRTQSFMQSKDYIAFRLTGQRVTDPTDASGVLGMELRTSRWSEEFFQDLGIEVCKLPEIVPSASICGCVTSEAAALTGLRQGTPVVTGTGDLASAATGSKVDSGTVSLTLGTAGQLLAAGTKGSGRKLAEKLFIFAHADPQEELYLGSVPAGGFSFEWLAKMHNITVPEFFKLAESAALSSDLPLFMPYILGRGAPYMDYTPAGAWHDLDARHTLPELCRGAVFGTLCPLRQCTDILEKINGKRQNLILQALAAREAAVQQSACALFEQEKFITSNSEASLSGAAVVGAVAMNCFPDISTASDAMIKKHPLHQNQTPEAQELFSRFLKRIS